MQVAQGATLTDIDYVSACYPRALLFSEPGLPRKGADGAIYFGVANHPTQCRLSMLFCRGADGTGLKPGGRVLGVGAQGALAQAVKKPMKL